MKIATWNVNSVRARLQRLLGWLEREEPDALCLQELKVSDEDFPLDEIQDVGYRAAVFGQKTYNGVAILSRETPEDVQRGMGPDDRDPQARLISATVGGVRVISAYFPNGRSVGSDAFEYKLDWIDRLRQHMTRAYDPSDPIALLGDYNVAPDDLDAENPARWAESVLCTPDARAALARLADWGLQDVFRKHHPDGKVYSWWDYRMLAFPKNDGLRIDHVFTTGPLAERSVRAWVDRDQRKGGKADKPSDHAPVVVEFSA